MIAEGGVRGSWKRLERSCYANSAVVAGAGSTFVRQERLGVVHVIRRRWV